MGLLKAPIRMNAGTPEIIHSYIADTEAERPESPLIGEDCYCKDTKKTYTCTAVGPVVWEQTGGSAAPGGPHTHDIDDVTDLQTELDGKSDVGHTHAGGSDPWTMVVLESLFSTTNATNTNVTGLAFTPAANKRYVVECYFLLRTATATVGPRPGFSFPTGLTDGGAWMEAPTSATAKVFRSWGPLNTQNAASTGVPTTTDSHLALGGALIICGATPSGNFQVTLASETAGTSVTMRVGSFIRYREI